MTFHSRFFTILLVLCLEVLLHVLQELHHLGHLCFVKQNFATFNFSRRLGSELRAFATMSSFSPP